MYKNKDGRKKGKVGVKNGRVEWQNKEEKRRYRRVKTWNKVVNEEDSEREKRDGGTERRER